jgi:hypothetical protein
MTFVDHGGKTKIPLAPHTSTIQLHPHKKAFAIEIIA